MTLLLKLELFDIWGIEFMGTFVIFYGMKYILVVIDYVLKWVKAMTLRNNKEKSVTSFLKKNIFPDLVHHGLLLVRRLIDLYSSIKILA